jgi:CHAT domain-containing protein
MSGFERVARNAGAMDLRLSYSDSVQRAYDSMILLQARTRRDPLAALGYLERAKNLALGTSITTGRDAAATRWRAAADNSLQGAVVAFAVLEDRVLRWTMVRGAVTFEEKPIARRDLVTLVEGFVDSIRRVGSNRGDPRFESALSDLLLPADLSELNEGEPITFVPDRELFLLPFAALVPNGKEAPLVSRHPVSISLSLRRERAEGERATPLPRSFSFLLVGNPATARSAGLSVRRLPGAEEEVARVSRLAGPGRAVILTGGQAIKERVMAEISKHEVFTFAGHSVSDPDLPSRSHLLLAPSTPSDLGVLAAAELEGKDLGKLRLVVLSSCSSLGSRASRSAGVAGIARPFLEAPGVDVLGTLWPIADRVSADFLLDFYERLEEGKDPRTALWLAQKRAAQGARSRRPMTWAAYEMITPNL